jgi:hypothetical protein
VRTTTTATIDELCKAGLCDTTSEHHLTHKGRDWLRALEEIQTEEITVLAEASDEDFVQATSGLFR